MAEPRITVLDDPESLYVHAAEEIAHIAGEAICSHGEFTFCLSGGSTPEKVYELLATRFKLSVDWKEVQFFWGDERCVPPAHPHSNYGMAERAMLSKLELRSSQIHRIRGEDPPSDAARKYEDEVRAACAVGPGEFPHLDMVLLGLGENRHTASLFPGSPALHEMERLAVAVEVDAEDRNRITLTPPAINSARRVMFIAAGQAKAEAVRDVLEGPHDPDRIPAQAIAPVEGEILWMLDRAAASLLSAR
jgi:6-phosphogluconolactonase